MNSSHGDEKVTTIKAHFALERETKGAVRFQETDANGAPITIENGASIGTLYVRKTALNRAVPRKLYVEVTYDNGDAA